MPGAPSISEERDLLADAQRGDRAAHDRLWQRFHGFAKALARLLARTNGLDRADAQREAIAAIPKAIDSFDLSSETRFALHLGEHIRAALATLPHSKKPPPPGKRVAWTPPGRFWSPEAVLYAKSLRRLNDRKIIEWLWFESPPRTQADIARRLGVSRSSVCRRRRLLMENISKIDPNALFDEPTKPID